MNNLQAKHWSISILILIMIYNAINAKMDMNYMIIINVLKWLINYIIY